MPLLNTPWILDADTTVKPIYGHQEAAEKGYNPEKPGRPSHTYHTYMIANLRLILETEVKAGNQSHSNYSLPGLMTLLTELNPAQRPYCVRGDMGWGTDSAMTELENINQHFLFKLRKSPKVVQLIHQHHIRGEWINLQSGWQAKEAQVTLQGWEKSRRAIIVRRQLKQDAIIGLERVQEGHPQMTLLDGPEDIKAFEYSVLITSLEADLITLFQLYRDRADCENNFDELKNQWGWGGYTTQDVKSCRLMARIIALICQSACKTFQFRGGNSVQKFPPQCVTLRHFSRRLLECFIWTPFTKFASGIGFKNRVFQPSPARWVFLDPQCAST